MKTTRRHRWLIGLVLTCCAACSFESAAPPSNQPSAGAPSSAAGSASSAGSAAVGGSAGSAATSTGGSAGAAEGGAVTQGGSGGAAGNSHIAGSAGMNVAGGPPVFGDKPLSVVAYSPYRDGQAPGAAQPSLAQVRADLEMLRPYVDGVRVYGTDGANAYIPALCDELGIDLHLGAWIDGLTSDEPNVRALAAIVNDDHPSIKTAIVGNEVLERAEDNGVTEARLIELIGIYKSVLTNPDVPTAAADTYPVWMAKRPNLAAAVDLVIWHTYGYWAGADIAAAYPLVSKRYDDMLAAYPSKPLILGETGWPTMFSRMSADGSSTAVGSEANQARLPRSAGRHAPATCRCGCSRPSTSSGRPPPARARWGRTGASGPRRASPKLPRWS